MSDYKKPRTNLNNFLPAQLRSALLLNLNENLFNRYLTKDEFTHTVGIIGDSDPTSVYKQIAEPTAYRQEEQLQPVISATVGTDTQYMAFQDFLERLSRLDVDVSEFDQWGKCLQFNFVPPIDIDKLINYRNYYWSSTDITETPDYITIKNQENWAQARAFEFKKLIASIQPSFALTLVDQLNAYLPGNQLASFATGDQVLLSDGANYYTNTISSITLNPTTGRTMINFKNVIPSNTVTTIYSLLVDVVSIDAPNKKFVVNGDLSGLFIQDYIFLAPTYQNNANALLSVASSTYHDNTVDKTTITVVQDLPLTSNWNKISLYPLIALTDEEYKSIVGGNYIQYNVTWNNAFLGNIIWDRELQLLTSTTGYTELGDHGLRDNSNNFVNLFVRPGDYLVINDGPVTGKYLIISVENNFLGIDSSVRMFTKQGISYVIERETFYDYILSAIAPTNPQLYTYWSNSTNDTLYQWNGTTWVAAVTNISLLVNATHQRYKLSLTQTDAWSQSNKWIHKNQITSYSGKTRAQLPIIEFDPFLELSYTSMATYDWQYRKQTTDLYSDTVTTPTLFEISNVKLVNGNEFVFTNNNTIMFSQQFGNLSEELVAGSTIKLTGFTTNNGIYEIASSSYKQRTPTSRFTTYVVLKNKINDPFDLPLNATIGPEKTSTGDTWLGYDAHWIFYGLKDINASSVGPTINPALNVFVNSYVDNVNGFETNIGLAWQSYSYLQNNNVGPIVPLDPSLHDLVLYDDYQEGDIRIYINEVRQYGNFQDIQAPNSTDYIGSVKFDSTVIINSGDLLRIELGEYALSDVGRRAITVKTNENLVDTTLPYNLVNWTTVRMMEQDKQTKNEYPWFTVYDIHGDAKNIASRIFTYQEDSSYALNQYILKRIVYNADTQDYGFVQELADTTTGELYSYKNFSQPNYPLQTVWKRGLNNEQYQPTWLADGSWEIPNPWFYNIDHELRSDLMYSEIYNHFSTIINAQSVPGVIKSNSINNFYVDDNVNYGIGGTIKEHNNGMDVLASSVFVNNVNPLLLIQFAHDRYTGALNYLQEEYIDSVCNYLLSTTYADMATVQTKVTDSLIDNYETNSKFDAWFGDSTTYNVAAGTGIKNWIATLPYLNLAPKVTPYIVSDTNLGIVDVVCHDGHREHVNMQATIIQKLNNFLLSKGAVRQVITSNGTAFPTGTLGAIVVRVNTTQNTTRTYRYSNTNVWEEFVYSDILANVFLAIETDLYNNCPETATIYDFTQNETNTRYNSLLNTQFSTHAKNLNISTPLLNVGYQSNNPFTWNYEFTPIPQSPSTGTISYDTAADYRSLYNKLYGTPYPHREPWAIQGYTTKPVWWDTQYKDTSGARVWSNIMWFNINSGTVPNGFLLPNGNISNGLSNQVRKFRYLPVNMGGTATKDGYVSDALLPPYWNSQNTTTAFVGTPYDAATNEAVVSPNLDYTFGDGNPNEWNWTVSAQRLYDNLVLAFKIDPLHFTNVTFDGNQFVKINCLDVDPTTSKVFSHADTVFHGDIINGNEVYQSNGFNQWYINYNRYFGYDGDASQFQPFWKDWSVNLAYLFGSYVDKASFAISNATFDITEKDYDIEVKKTIGFSDIWMDSLQATVLSVPSKYSTLRDNGIGWTVQFNSSSPTNNNIQFYPKENFDFRAVKGSNVFEIYAYDMEGAGIVYPFSYVTVSYSETLSDNLPTNYQAGKEYTAIATIGTQSIGLIIKANDVSTISDAISSINDQLGTSATAYLSSGNIIIQSEESVTVNDTGLFVSLASNYLGVSSQNTTDFEFDSSFDVNGNLTSLFVEGDSFTITDSTQFNGTYTVKSVYYDISNTVTKIFVNEKVVVSSATIDGILRPSNRRTLPDTWVNGTEVYLSTMGTLPAPFNEFRQYYVTRVDNYTFQLSLMNGGGPITALTASTAQQFVGRIKYTFKANGGDVTGYSWRQHYSDTRQVMSYAQPIYISGIQQIIDFIDGYSDYMEFLGFSPVTKDIFNTKPGGVQITWQSETEDFIDDLYIARSTNQNDNMEFGVKVDVENSRFLYTDSKVSLAANQANATLQIVFESATGGRLPAPIDNPLKEFIPYYVMPSNDGLGFQIAYTQSDARKGIYIQLTDTGIGNLKFSLYTGAIVYPQYWLNPYQNAFRLNHPQGILSNVLTNDRMDVLTNQKIYDVNGKGISPKKVYVLRQDEYSQVFLTDETKRNNASSNNPTIMAGIHAFIDAYEHVILFNDRTITDDLIYDPFLGIRTPRFLVEFDRQLNYTLRPNVGGFFVYNDNLVQNFESSVDDLRYMNDAYEALESKPLIKYLRQSMGYQGQQSFLKNLNINAKSDFIFWRGMIKNKGTNFAIDAYTNQAIFNNADLDEFWAYKLAEFGDAKPKTYLEMKLQRVDSIGKEARFEFVNPEEEASDETFTPIAVTDKTRWWNQPDVVASLAPDQSFFINASVTAIALNQQNAIVVVDNEYLLQLGNPADGVVVTYVDINGNTKILSLGLDYEMLSRNVVKFITNYDPRTLSQLSISTISYNYAVNNPAVFIDKLAGVILDQIEIWNPAEGQHFLEAHALLDYKIPEDPAVYTNDFTGTSYNNIWTTNSKDKVWLDTSTLFYLPYDDAGIYPNVNDRIDLWGKLADNGALNVYQWTESTVAPSDYTTEYPDNGTPRQLLYQNLGTQDQPSWLTLVPSYANYLVMNLTPTTAPFAATVAIYRNGKFDMNLNLTAFTLYQYAFGNLIPGQTVKPAPSDTIVVQTILPVPTKQQLNDLVFKYDTPYSTATLTNATDGGLVTMYYYWVQNRTDVITSVTNYQSSSFAVQKNLTNNPNPYMLPMNLRYQDDGYGVNYGNVFDGTPYNLPVRYTQLVIKGFKGLISEEDRFALRFLNDFTLRDKMPFHGDLYNLSSLNKVASPLALKNKHVEWKLFREKQTQKVDAYLWDKLISALVGYNVSNNVIDQSTTIPSLDRILFDQIYDAGTRYGLDSDQVFVDPTIGLSTIMSILTDPTQTFANIDIVSFLQTNKFDNVSDIVASMYAIYDSFDASNINAIYFSVLSDAMALKKESPDFFKTSWVALDISQNVNTSIQNYTASLGNIVPGGSCDIDENIVVPTQPPLPSPSPTPSVTASVTASATATVTPSVTATPSVTGSLTPTPSVTGTPFATGTPTPTVTASVTGTPSNTVTPTVSATISLTPTLTRTPSLTSSPTPSPTLSPVGNSCYDTIVLNDMPLLYYKMDDFNTNIAKDYTNQGRDGLYEGNIIQGGPGLFSTSVRSVEFPNDFSQNNFIFNQYGSYLNLPNDFTMEIFADANAADQHAAIPSLVYLAYNSLANQPQFQLYVDMTTGKYAFQISTSDFPAATLLSNTLANGTPHVITCKRAGDTLHMFIDGKEEVSMTVTGTNNVTSANGIMLGGAPYNTPSLYNYVGSLDCFSLYNVALTDSDIASRFVCISGNPITPSPTPTMTPTPSVSSTPTPSPSITPSRSISATPSISISQTPSTSHSATPSPTPPVSPTQTPAPSPTPAPSITPSPSTAPFTASVPSGVSGSCTALNTGNSCTANTSVANVTVTNGSGNYSYHWFQVSGVTATISNPTQSGTSFGAANVVPDPTTGTTTTTAVFYCQVTDNVTSNVTNSNNITATFNYTNSS